MDAPYYVIDGIRYPRLTRVLSILREPEVEVWQATTVNAEEESGKARQLGTVVHAAIAADITGEPVKMSTRDGFHSCWVAYQRWKHHQEKTVQPMWVCEQPYVQREGRYACTVDYAEWDSVTGVVREFKTSTRIQEKYWLQLSAQAAAVWEDWRHRQITLQVVRLDKVLGEYEQQMRTLIPADVETFFHLVQVYRRWYGHELEKQDGTPEVEVADGKAAAF